MDSELKSRKKSEYEALLGLNGGDQQLGKLLHPSWDKIIQIESEYPDFQKTRLRKGLTKDKAKLKVDDNARKTSAGVR